MALERIEDGAPQPGDAEVLRQVLALYEVQIVALRNRLVRYQPYTASTALPEETL